MTTQRSNYDFMKISEVSLKSDKSERIQVVQLSNQNLLAEDTFTIQNLLSSLIS